MDPWPSLPLAAFVPHAGPFGSHAGPIGNISRHPTHVFMPFPVLPINSHVFPRVPTPNMIKNMFQTCCRICSHVRQTMLQTCFAYAPNMSRICSTICSKYTLTVLQICSKYGPNVLHICSNMLQLCSKCSSICSTICFQYAPKYTTYLHVCPHAYRLVWTGCSLIDR